MKSKALGFTMGDPYHLKRAELKKHRVAVFSSNYTLYGDMSRRVMQTLAAFTPELEIYSIDEAFLNVAGFEPSGLSDYARTIRAEVKQATGIPVSIGIGVTKTLAKIANRLAKKTPESGGVCNLLQFSTVKYENLSSDNVAYYAEGQANLSAGAVGYDTSSVYANTGINQTVGAKQFILTIVGTSIRIEDMSIAGVPSGDTIVGGTKGAQASDGTYTWTLPINSITSALPFTLLYPVNQTTDPNDPSSWPTITVSVNGLSTHGFYYHSRANFSFEYIAQTDAAQILYLPLNTYALQTQDAPYQITLGDGNNIVYGARNNDTITSGNGNSQIYESNGNDLITVGDGNNTIVAGNGNDLITFGSGSNTISVGTGNDTITGRDGGNNAITVSSLATQSQTGTVNITTGQGNDTITVYGGHGTITAHAGTGNTATSSTSAFTIATTGTGTTNITGGDGEYTVTTGEGSSTVSLGAGDQNITTGTGDARVSVGHGHDTITTGAGNSYVTVNGGGGTITTGSIGGKVSDIQVRNTSASDVYQINLNGAGGAVVNAVDGNYTVNGSAGTGNDTITLGAGNSSITTGTGDAQVSVGHGHDTITTGSGNSYVTVNGGGGTITTYSAGSKFPTSRCRTRRQATCTTSI